MRTAGAETAAVELQRRGYARVDAVLSSLGFGMMPEALSRKILLGLVPFLDARSAFTQFQYLHSLRWLESNGNGMSKVEFFDLRVFQRPSGADLRVLSSAAAETV